MDRVLRRRRSTSVVAGVVVALILSAALDAGPLGAATPRSAITTQTIEVGPLDLKGTLTLPAGEGKVPAVILVAGSGPDDQNETVGHDAPFLDLATGLAADGIATIRYDKRTLDDPTTINLATFTPKDEYVTDAVAAVALAKQQARIDPKRIFILGHSQGGLMAPEIAKEAPGVAGVILEAAEIQPLQDSLLRQIKYLIKIGSLTGTTAQTELKQAKEAVQEVDNPALSLTNKATWPTSPILGGAGAAYFLYLRAYNALETARHLKLPILILQGLRDYQVTPTTDFDVWRRGLKGVKKVHSRTFAADDHLMIPGTGIPSPADYLTPGHVDPTVIAAIASWVSSINLAG